MGKKGKKKKANRQGNKRKRPIDKNQYEATAPDFGSREENVASSSWSVQVKVNTNIAAVAESASSKEKSCGGLSWSSAFAAAASLKPQELDEDFLRRTNTQSTHKGLAKISQFAKENQQQQSLKLKEDKPNVRDTESCESDQESHKPEDMVNEPARKKRKMFKCADKAAEYLDETSENVQKTSDDEPLDSTENEMVEEEVSLEGRMVPHPNNDAVQVMILVDTNRLEVYSATERADDGELIQIGHVVDGLAVFNNDAFQDSTNEDSIDNDESNPVSFPFPIDPNDHCESPLESYQDISLFLNTLCRNGKSKDRPLIYDPYYCNGAVVRNLNSLGFPNVHNENKDCYKVWSTGIGYPNFDVLITNPPYSGNHVEKLMQHVTDKNYGARPWLLLMPTWVHKRDFYKRAVDKIQPFYLVPRKRYVYLPPKDFRDKRKSDVHKKSSPFVSMWYIWGGTTSRTQKWIELYRQSVRDETNPSCDLARSRSALRDLRRKVKTR